MKKLLLVLALVATVFSATAQAEPLAGRMWENINFTAVLSPDWAFTIMPGHRWEFSRNGAPNATSDTYFQELFIGPTLTMKLSDSLKFKLPVWYYYMGFPNRFNGTYRFSHNLEILPIFEYKLDANLMISSRSIFHNTFFTSMNGSGWSTLLREMILINYTLSPTCTIFAGNEIFIGLLTDGTYAGAYGPGFSPSGIDENRVIAGFTYKLTPEISITPQYIYSNTWPATAGVGNSAIAGVPSLSAHNFYLTVGYTMKCF